MATEGESEPETLEDIEGEDADEILEEVERKRSLRGIASITVAAIAISFSAFQMWIAARGREFEFGIPLSGTGFYDAFGDAVSVIGVTLPADGVVRIAALQTLQINTLHVTFGLVIAFLLYPPSTGDGRVVKRLGRYANAAENVAPEGRATEGVDAVRRFGRWFAVDSEMERVTPLDIVIIVLALLPAYYTATEFEEISNVLRVRGLGAGRPVGEVWSILDPVAVGPLDDTSLAFILGIIGVLLVIEATRRALGVLLMSLIIVFILYAYLGHFIPRGLPGVGIFSITETPWTSIVRDLWYNTESGIMGRPVGVSVRFIYIFILFGAFLEMSGAGKWFIDLAYSMTGTRRGGPAKASTVSSAFMGMISGSSVANTVTTGAFTIPLMKRSGYSPEFSGAVESSVSSGGQILPPVMGAAAFLIVEYTGTPYREVIIHATLPALAFFFGMWVMVHFEASKRGIGGVSRDQLAPILPHLKHGWFYLAPVLLLLYWLVISRKSIPRAGWFTIASIIALISLVAAYDKRVRGPFLGSLTVLFGGTVLTQYLYGTTLTGFLKGGAGEGLGFVEAVFAAFGGFALLLISVSVVVMLLRPTVRSPVLELDPAVNEAAESIDSTLGRKVATTRPGTYGTFILKSMEKGAQTAVIVVVAVAAAGVIPGVISVTGLGPNLTSLILTVGDTFLLLLIVSGIAAIMLGMGMPTTVMYIILIAVMGGAFAAFDTPQIAAHLYVLYFGLMADVTPPVMVAAYAAAGVAKSDAFETGKLAFMLSLNKILVPFAFIYTPGILLFRGTGFDAPLMGWSDVYDLGFFLPEVLIPIIGMFAGVYAMGVTIIGYRNSSVDRRRRSLWAIASVAMMVPALLISPIGGATSLLGLNVSVLTTTTDLAVRGAGAVLFVFLIRADNKKTEEEEKTKEENAEKETEEDET